MQSTATEVILAIKDLYIQKLVCFSNPYQFHSHKHHSSPTGYFLNDVVKRYHKKLSGSRFVDIEWCTCLISKCVEHRWLHVHIFIYFLGQWDFDILVQNVQGAYLCGCV